MVEATVFVTYGYDDAMKWIYRVNLYYQDNGEEKRCRNVEDAMKIMKEERDIYDNIEICYRSIIGSGRIRMTTIPSFFPFEGITILDCSDNGLTHLLSSNLPPRLIELSCAGNKLSSLPNDLPETLRTINCSVNHITKLPDTLPNGLKILICHNNPLTVLPENLPRELKDLVCCDCLLLSLPDNLPEGLVTIDCGGNKLKDLPKKLPPKLEVLLCTNNDLTDLPPKNLPQTLNRLDY